MFTAIMGIFAINAYGTQAKAHPSPPILRIKFASKHSLSEQNSKSLNSFSLLKQSCDASLLLQNTAIFIVIIIQS